MLSDQIARVDAQEVGDPKRHGSPLSNFWIVRMLTPVPFARAACVSPRSQRKRAIVVSLFVLPDFI